MALDNLRLERNKKLENFQNKGVNPFPSKTDRSQTISAAREMYSEHVSVAGRVRSLRPHGKIVFIDLEDITSRIQLFFSKSELAEENYTLLSDLDIGDFIQAQGEVFKTEAGEITVRVKDWKVLAKALLPLPSAWYGLKDIEERYRRRYLDLIMNPESRSIFEKRSKIVHFIRKFLVEEKGYMEVETPVLQPLYGGTRARPFVTHHNTLDMDLYLRISSELYLKRLIVGGFEKVFEIGHTFRNEGMDRNHNPEFTMLETMEAYANYFDNMNLVEEIFEYVALKVFGRTKLPYQGAEIDYKRPWQRISFSELFEKHAGIAIEQIDTIEKATDLARNLGVEIRDYMSTDEILLEIFEKKCTDQLIQPTFVYDYPADFFPLAKRKADNPKFVESFDIYVAGMEMGTNYSEQNNPRVLREAWLSEKGKEEAGNEETQKLDEDFLEALEYGMPPTSGIGPGLDRWVMVMTDSPAIMDVILFPTMRSRTVTQTITDKARIVQAVDSRSDNLGITRDQAYQLVTEMLQNKNLVRHCLAVEAIMRSLAGKLKEMHPELSSSEFNPDEWGIVGLLHDADYEVTNKDLQTHTDVIIEKLRSLGASERIINGILGHHEIKKPNRENFLEKAIYAADELSGLIVAVALIRPDKKLSSVTAESVLKKFPEKSFAAGAKREQILTCETEFSIPLADFVQLALAAMQDKSDELGM